MRSGMATKGATAQRKKRIFLVIGVGFLAVLLLWTVAGKRHAKVSKHVKEILAKPLGVMDPKLAKDEKIEQEDEDRVEEDEDKEEDLESEEEALENELDDQDEVLNKMAGTYNKGLDLVDEMTKDKEEVQKTLDETNDPEEKAELEKYLGKLDAYIEKVEGLDSEVKSDMAQVYSEESRVEDRIYDIQSEEIEDLEDEGDDLQALLNDNKEKRLDLNDKINEESDEEQILQATLLEDLSDDDRVEIEEKLAAIHREHDEDMEEIVEVAVEEEDIKDEMSSAYEKELSVDEAMDDNY